MQKIRNILSVPFIGVGSIFLGLGLLIRYGQEHTRGMAELMHNLIETSKPGK